MTAPTLVLPMLQAPLPVVAFELQWEDLTFAGVILAWITLLLWGSKYVEYLWIGALGRRPFRLFVAPGVIVHEYSHALACVLTGAKIHEIKLFKADGGHVKHDRPNATLFGLPFLSPKKEERRTMTNFLRWRFLSSFFISFAPIFGCLFCIWLLTVVLSAVTGKSVMSTGDETTSASRPPSSTASAAKPVSATAGNGTGTAEEQETKRAVADAGDFGKFADRVWRTFLNIWGPVWHFPALGIVYLWLLLSFTVCMAPSERDFANSIVGIFVLLIALFVVSVALGRSESGALDKVISAILPLVSYTTAVMLCALVVSTILAPTVRAITRGR